MTIKIGQSQVHASGQGSDDAVGNSPGVHQKLTEGIGSLPGWRKGVRQKKTETHRKIVGLPGVGKVSGQGLDDAEGACREFAKRFAEGIGKLVRNMPGDRRMKTIRLAAVESGGYRNAGVRSLSLMAMFDCNL
ncbi:hypothetical protein GW17_00043276 [Ensete ventricosum]|nr:hypothetical protein GW17_00043276 [Ensete ventricosum]